MAGVRCGAVYESARRGCDAEDFTINGLLLDPLRGTDDLRLAVIDYVGGLGIWMPGCCGPLAMPRRRFEEDHLRMLRGIRFAARFGLRWKRGRGRPCGRCGEDFRGEPGAGAG